MHLTFNYLYCRIISKVQTFLESPQIANVQISLLFQSVNRKSRMKHIFSKFFPCFFPLSDSSWQNQLKVGGFRFAELICGPSTSVKYTHYLLISFFLKHVLDVNFASISGSGPSNLLKSSHPKAGLYVTAQERQRVFPTPFIIWYSSNIQYLTNIVEKKEEKQTECEDPCIS